MIFYKFIPETPLCRWEGFEKWIASASLVCKKWHQSAQKILSQNLEDTDDNADTILFRLIRTKAVRLRSLSIQWAPFTILGTPSESRITRTIVSILKLNCDSLRQLNFIPPLDSIGEDFFQALSRCSSLWMLSLTILGPTYELPLADNALGSRYDLTISTLTNTVFSLRQLRALSLSINHTFKSPVTLKPIPKPHHLSVISLGARLFDSHYDIPITVYFQQFSNLKRMWLICAKIPSSLRDFCNALVEHLDSTLDILCIVDVIFNPTDDKESPSLYEHELESNQVISKTFSRLTKLRKLDIVGPPFACESILRSHMPNLNTLFVRWPNSLSSQVIFDFLRSNSSGRNPKSLEVLVIWTLFGEWEDEDYHSVMIEGEKNGVEVIRDGPLYGVHFPHPHELPSE
jgi:hypothetical protein